jgi:hypothetical protein
MFRPRPVFSPSFALFAVRNPYLVTCGVSAGQMACSYSFSIQTSRCRSDAASRPASVALEQLDNPFTLVALSLGILPHKEPFLVHPD